MEGFGATTVGVGNAYYGAMNMSMDGSRTGAYKDANPRAVRPVGRPWHDGEWKRRKRVAKYKFYSVEGKVKNSFRKGLRWFKKTCSRIVHGF
ncbi:hypothetical protein ACP275_14G204200 [Erythranthe tilingii]